MFVRAAISLTLMFYSGSAFAEWQSQTVASKPSLLQVSAPQAASGQVQASLSPETKPIETEVKPVAKPGVEELIREGNKRMREGDILGARQSYQKALAFEDAAAALVMGRSYDPIYFARIVGGNAEPDPAKAFEWYRRAMDAGAAQTATVRIEALKLFIASNEAMH